MNDRGKSDGPVIPAKPPNKAGSPAAGAVEGRGPAEGNAASETRSGRRAGPGAPSELERVRQVARRDKDARFTALLHHVSLDRLRAAYRALSPKAAPGVDGVTWEAYGRDLEANLRDLHARLHRGAYRAKPSRRSHISKADGRQRPLGIAALEDKIVQRAVVWVLSAIYEEDFLGFSYGFRPGRSPHHALDALAVGITRRSVNWVLDADFREAFTSLDHRWLVSFLEHRIADKRILRLIQKWLSAGVIEDGSWTPEEGVPQGASVSPLLANVYLHYVLDLWVQQWRRRHAHGEVIVVRFADDLVLGFEHRDDAESFWADLRERLARFGLELHPDKTRLIEFGRFAAERRAAAGQRRPETFDFLGFTHYCGRTRSGRFVVKRKTQAKRMVRKLKAVRQDLLHRMHAPVREQHRWLGQVLRGHYRYYGVIFNYRALRVFKDCVVRLWRKVLGKRSQKGRVSWASYKSILTAFPLPEPVLHQAWHG
jgi:RNA-directed DNA polymerase